MFFNNLIDDNSFFMKNLFLFILFSAFLFSQNNSTFGIVINENEKPLFNVNIITEPSGQGTQTNSNGNFIIEFLDSDSVLIIQHIGYEKKKVKILDFKNGETITLIQNVIELQSLEVRGVGRNQFDVFDTKNSVISLDAEELAFRGFNDIGDALFSEQSIVMNETMTGQKSISIRASSSEEISFLYDGIQINNMGDPLVDLSIFSASGLNGLELVKGSHDKSIAASGTINFIPKITYGNSARFTQQFGTYDYGGYDGLVTVGNSSYSLNTGAGKGQFSQTYVGSEFPEISTIHNRQFGNIGLKYIQNFEFRFMGFKNKKLFNNIRSKDSISVSMETFIGKVIYSKSPIGEIQLYAITQNNNGNESSLTTLIQKNDHNQGFGIALEKPINHATIKLSSEFNNLDSKWIANSLTMSSNRYQSILTGSLELIRPETKEKFQLKDAKIVLNKSLINDTPESKTEDVVLADSWDESSSMFTVSFLNIDPVKRVMVYTNLGNAFRFPSLNEKFSNYVRHLNNYSLYLNPELKTTIEMGLKIQNVSEDEMVDYSINISGFTYRYSNKIKQIIISGAPIQFPINYGDASLSGFDSQFSLVLNNSFLNFTSFYSNYIFSDPIAFQMQPDKIVRNIVSLTYKWIKFDLIHRSESHRQATSIDSFGNELQTRLDPVNTIDANIVFNLIFKDYVGTVSLTGKNLNNVSQDMNGISLFDKRIGLNFGLSWK